MIIALAHRLKIVTIAEGVETQEQKIYMRSHGVDLLQGYYYARPLPVEDFPRWLAEEKHRLAATGGKKQPAGQV